MVAILVVVGLCTGLVAGLLCGRNRGRWCPGAAGPGTASSASPLTCLNRRDVAALTVEETGLAHQADRTSYQCIGCSKPWPCAPAREHLVTMSDDRPQLAIRMWNEWEHAVMGPLRREPVGELVERFARSVV
jgi:hypothetical protein